MDAFDDIDFDMTDLPRLSREEVAQRKAERDETSRRIAADILEKKARKSAARSRSNSATSRRAA